MKRDKKARGGVPRFVLLGDDGPLLGVAVPSRMRAANWIG